VKHARTRSADHPEKFDAERDGTPYDAGATDTESGPTPDDVPADVPQSAIDTLSEPQVRSLPSHRQGPRKAGETGEGSEPLIDGGSGGGASEPGGSGGG